MRRFLFPTRVMKEAPRIPADVLVVGTGVAGLFFALHHPGRSLLVSKSEAFTSNSSLAQGGVACAIGAGDSAQAHFNDTLKAGAGLCDEEMVWTLVREGPGVIKDLFRLGVHFDRQSGHLDLGQEGSHTLRRILHVQDRTGDEIIRVLYERALAEARIRFLERTYLVDVLTDQGQVTGAFVLGTSGPLVVETSRVILASGGYAFLFEPSTNPPDAVGEGIMAAYRAGANLSDLEFVQFHPTALHHNDVPRFLISEAVRGEGAVLRNQAGARFMPEIHPMAELAPRDVVAQAIYRQMQQEKTDHVFLDFTSIDADVLTRHFPVILAKCQSLGLDPRKDWVPVSPAAHYTMGGVRTDSWGATSLPGLYAVGEVACTGVHGANRLASNSMLEGMVFGRRLATHLSATPPQLMPLVWKEEKASKERPLPPISLEALRCQMGERVGILRDAGGLRQAWDTFCRWQVKMERSTFLHPEECRLHNSATLASLVALTALTREESRGAHQRIDFPERNDRQWHTHIQISWVGGEEQVSIK